MNRGYKIFQIMQVAGNGCVSAVFGVVITKRLQAEHDFLTHGFRGLHPHARIRISSGRSMSSGLASHLTYMLGNKRTCLVPESNEDGIQFPNRGSTGGLHHFFERILANGGWCTDAPGLERGVRFHLDFAKGRAKETRFPGKWKRFEMEERKKLTA